MREISLANARGSEWKPSRDRQGANHRSGRSGESGFALLLVFLMAAAISISLYYEIPRVAFQSQRQKEQLLIERGEQYKRAIQLFVRANGRYPGKIEDLENFNNRRFLRHKFTDPISGKDEWRIIHVNGAGVFYDSVLNKKKTDDKQQASTGPQFVAEEPGLGSNLNTGQPATNPGLRRRTSEGGQPNAIGPDGQPVQYATGVVPIPGQPSQPYQPAPGMPGVANPGGLPTNVVPVLPGVQAGEQQSQAFPGTPGGQPNPAFPFNGGVNNPVATNTPGTPLPAELNNFPGGARFPNQPGVPPGLNQPGLNQPGFNPGLNQPGFNQPGATPGFNPTGTQTPGFGQTGFNQPGFPQPGVNQTGFNQPGFNQPGVNQPGNNQTGGSSFVGGGGSFVGGSSFVGGGGSFVGGSATPSPGTVNPVSPSAPFPQPVQPPIPQPNQPFPQANQPFPQANQPFPQANQPFPTPQAAAAQNPGTPISSGSNSATDMIGRILTSPRPGGAPDGVQQAGQTTVGGGIAGVASLSEDPAIMVYHDRTNYNEWEFLFDLSKQRALANPNGGVVGTPAQAIGNVPGSPGFGTPGATPGFGATQSTGFGASPAGGFGATPGPGGLGGAFAGGLQPSTGAIGAGLQSANPAQNTGPGQTAGAAQNGQLGTQTSAIPPDIRLGRP